MQKLKLESLRFGEIYDQNLIWVPIISAFGNKQLSVGILSNIFPVYFLAHSAAAWLSHINAVKICC